MSRLNQTINRNNRKVRWRKFLKALFSRKPADFSTYQGRELEQARIARNSRILFTVAGIAGAGWIIAQVYFSAVQTFGGF